MKFCRRKPDAVSRIMGGEETPQLFGCVQFIKKKEKSAHSCVRIFGGPTRTRT